MSSSVKFYADYDKLGRASCKRCKQKIEKGSFRIGKSAPNPFSPESEMKLWFHPNCMFDAFSKQRSGTARIDSSADVDGYAALQPNDKSLLVELIKGGAASPSKTKGANGTAASSSSLKQCSPKKLISSFAALSREKSNKKQHSSGESNCPDVLFTTFCSLCSRIAKESSYTKKTEVMRKFILNGECNHPFCGDVEVLLRLLLPNEKGAARIFNLGSIQLGKLFARLFGLEPDDLADEVVESGDVAATIAAKFETNKQILPLQPGRCSLTIADLDNWLNKMSDVAKEDSQLSLFRELIPNCGTEELRYVILLLRHDLRMNAKARHILDALGPTAYEAYQASRDLSLICREWKNSQKTGSDIVVGAKLLTPVQPMLAEACKSVEFAFKKVAKGGASVEMFAEIKYDGERVQVHKSGTKFSFFSRSLKPVQDHKVDFLRNVISKAFATSDDIILDGEILLVDKKTHLPLPFGTLGIHKKKGFSDAQECFFVFDCIFMNGSSLMAKPLDARRKILEKEMTPIADRIVLSEAHRMTKPAALQVLLDRVFAEKLEGLVLKPADSLYEPGKRHWLKIKKDYLSDGAMADTADLIVLGGYYGTGRKGGLVSVFLLGCFDPSRKKFLTVTKCGNGFDDQKLDSLQKELKLVKTGGDMARLPSWLVVLDSQLVPDFVVADPKASPVWEISGAEFSKSDKHSADGISIRFPRVTRFRDDKDWASATSLDELKVLFENSRGGSGSPVKMSLDEEEPIASTSRSPPKRKVAQIDLDDSEEEQKPVIKKKPAAPVVKKAAPSGKGPAKKKRVVDSDEETDMTEEDEEESTSDDSDEESGEGVNSDEDEWIPRDKTVSRKSATRTTRQNVPSEKAQQSKQYVVKVEDLPDIFKGLRVYVDLSGTFGTDQQRSLIKRNIAAFGGDIVDVDCEKTKKFPDNTTHVIVGVSAKVPQWIIDQAQKAPIKVVKSTWLAACIKDGKLVDDKPFLICFTL